MAYKSGPSAPPHAEGGEGLTFGATKKQARGASARETPVRGPNSRAPGDTGKSGRMPTGRAQDGILGKKHSGPGW